MIELVLASLGLFAFLRGGQLALRSGPKASSWMAGGAALTLALATRLSSHFAVAGALYLLAGTGVSTAAVLFIRERLLKRELRDALGDADDAEVRGLVHEARSNQIPRGDSL